MPGLAPKRELTYQETVQMYVDRIVARDSAITTAAAWRRAREQTDKLMDDDKVWRTWEQWVGPGQIATCFAVEDKVVPEPEPEELPDGAYRMEHQIGCARCGADEHFDLIYLPFTMPMVDLADGMIGTHYCPCPVNGEPIILFVGPKP